MILLVHLAWPAPRPRTVRFLPFLAIVALILHLSLEGYRWQMLGIYALTLGLSIATALRPRPAKERGWLASLFLVLILALATLVPVLLPVPAVPSTAGAWKVGTRSFELVDSSRKELYSGKDEARRFMIQVWYPAVPRPGDRHSPWMANAGVFAPAISKFMGLPGFFLDHLALVKVPAYQDAPAAQSQGGFPLLLFSHGWNGFNAQNTGEALLLASRGYIVVAPQHSYGAVVSVFPDGSIAKNNPVALPDGAPQEEYEIAARKLVDQWTGDLSFALSWMEAKTGDTSSPFAGLVDASRVGAFGHSTGGGAVIELASTDPRCKAVFGMDPFMRPVQPRVLDSGFRASAFFMFSQKWADNLGSRNNELFNRFYPHATGSLGAVSITGTDHFDFSDLPILTPLAPQLGLKGPLAGKRVTAIVEDYLLSFFELTLEGKATSLFGAPGSPAGQSAGEPGMVSPYPEVRKKQALPERLAGTPPAPRTGLRARSSQL
ncbi:MAG: hypothetical protein WCQ50_05025 [Spirochaetota bacterium]